MAAGACGRGELFTDGRKDKTPRTAFPSGPLPPARPHLLKFPERPKITPPGGDQACNTREPIWRDVSYSNHSRYPSYVSDRDTRAESMTLLCTVESERASF
jgi:hypothetical protein